MSRPPDVMKDLSDTLSMCEYKYKTSGNFGFWLYDNTRGMNLAMRAESETDAFVKALHYYQERLSEVEREHAVLIAKVRAFIVQLRDSEDTSSIVDDLLK